jgi:hypothetical protein
MPKRADWFKVKRSLLGLEGYKKLREHQIIGMCCYTLLRLEGKNELREAFVSPPIEVLAFM